MRRPPTTFFVSRTSSSFAPRVGPKVEIDFGERWSFETDFLYHRPAWTQIVRYDPPIPIRPAGPPVPEQIDRFDEPIIEIPVLAKHRFSLGRATLVLEVGPSFLPFGGFDGPGKIGVTGGVGTAFSVGRLRLQPTIRYSRWPSSPEEAAGGLGGGLPFRRDRVSLVVGADIPSTSLGTAESWALLSIGFIGGTTLTKDFPDENGFKGVSSRMAGVAFEYHWSERWGVEADVIYHPACSE